MHCWATQCWLQYAEHNFLCMQAQGAVQHEEPPAEQVPAQPLAQNGKPSAPEAEVQSLTVSLRMQKAAH